MGNALFILKFFLQDLLSSFGFTLGLLSLLATLFKDRIKLPFDTFWNKYIIIMWSAFFILLRIFRYYDLHKNKVIGVTQLIIVILGFLYAKGIFSSEVNIPMIKIMLVVFLITIIL